MTKICMYHGSDLDGICSAAIIKNRFPEVELYPMVYGQDFDCMDIINKDDAVYIVNFTLQPFEKMVECDNLANLVWIDHHDTSIEDYYRSLKDGHSKIRGIRNTTKGSCELVWEYMYPDIPVPYPVWMLSRYEVNDAQAASSIIAFQFGMMLNYQSPESVMFWDNVFNADRDGQFIQSIITSGRTIIKYRDKLNCRLCEVQAFETTLDGYNCVCINRALCGSTVFNSVFDCQKHDIMITFYIDGSGMWNVTLYTDDSNEVHVGNIAKKFGGGGQSNSAGFACHELPFNIGD